VEGWELYDLRNDQYEMKNLYNLPQYKKLVAQLKKQLLQLIDKYEDVEAKAILFSEGGL